MNKQNLRYTLQQRIDIIEIHYKNGESLAVRVRKTSKSFLGRRESPCRTAIQKLVGKFEPLGQVSDVMCVHVAQEQLRIWML